MCLYLQAIISGCGEIADTLDLDLVLHGVGVRVPSPAQKNLNKMRFFYSNARYKPNAYSFDIPPGAFVIDGLAGLRQNINEIGCFGCFYSTIAKDGNAGVVLLKVQVVKQRLDSRGLKNTRIS